MERGPLVGSSVISRNEVHFFHAKTAQGAHTLGEACLFDISKSDACRLNAQCLAEFATQSLFEEGSTTLNFGNVFFFDLHRPYLSQKGQVAIIRRRPHHSAKMRA